MHAEAGCACSSRLCASERIVEGRGRRIAPRQAAGAGPAWPSRPSTTRARGSRLRAPRSPHRTAGGLGLARGRTGRATGQSDMRLQQLMQRCRHIQLRRTATAGASRQARAAGRTADTPCRSFRRARDDAEQRRRRQRPDEREELRAAGDRADLAGRREPRHLARDRPRSSPPREAPNSALTRMTAGSGQSAPETRHAHAGQGHHHTQQTEHRARRQPAIGHRAPDDAPDDAGRMGGGIDQGPAATRP